MVAISPSHGGFPSQLGQGWKSVRGRPDRRSSNLRVMAEKGEERESVGGENKKSLFSSVTEALDFSAVRSSRDAELLDDARQATKAGGRMTREQVGTYLFVTMNVLSIMGNIWVYDFPLIQIRIVQFCEMNEHKYLDNFLNSIIQNEQICSSYFVYNSDRRSYTLFLNDLKSTSTLCICMVWFGCSTEL